MRGVRKSKTANVIVARSPFYLCIIYIKLTRILRIRNSLISVKYTLGRVIMW
jgi:hypothetical protein